MNTETRTITQKPLFPAAALLVGLALHSTASAQVVFGTPGAASYSYSAANNNPLPPASEAIADGNIVVDQVLNFPDGGNVTGVGTSDANPGTITFHFQTGPGLVFSNDINLGAGTSVHNSLGSVVADYSYDNSTWTTWGTNNNEATDKGLSATNVAAGQTDLYVRFTITAPDSGDGRVNASVTWGGGDGERAVTLTGTVVDPSAPPELSSLSPANNATDIAIGSNLEASFSEAVFADTGNIELWEVGGLSALETFDVATSTPPQLSFSGSTVTINPTSDLASNTQYYVLIGATAIKDSDDENFVGISDPADWTFTTAVPPHPVGLIGWWDFNDGNTAAGSGGIKDLATTGGTHDATLSGTGGAFSSDVPAALAGTGSRSLDLSAGGYAVVDTFAGDAGDANFNTGGALSVSFWLKGWPDGSPFWQPFVAKGGEADGWQIRRQSTGNNITVSLRGTTGTGDPTGPVVGPNPGWIHLAAIYDGTRRKLYVNGTLSSLDIADTGTISDASDLVSFGANAAGGELAGVLLDDIGIWNTALSESEITDLANGISPFDTFANWISGYSVGGQTALHDDPDGDGNDNGVENFFGTAPDAFSQGLVSGTYDAGAGTFTFTHPQGTIASDLTAAYRWSKDLVKFHGHDEADTGGTTVSFSTEADKPSEGFTTVTATVTGTPTDKLFLNLLVTQD